jgi:hypothetical protein
MLIRAYSSEQQEGQAHADRGTRFGWPVANRGGLVDSIVYGNLRIEILAEHGGRIQRTTLKAKPPTIQPRPRSFVLSGPARLQSRGAEVAAAQAVNPGEAMEFHAACGFGKSTLLRHLAAQADAEGQTAVVYLRVGGQHRDDLLQRIVDALYTANRPFKPTPEQRAQLLAQAQALLLLDDVTLGPSQLRGILDVLPGCTIVLGSDRPLLGRRGRSIPLTGLPNDAALEVLRQDLGRDLTGPERTAAERLCELVDGQPLHLRQAAALVREGRHSFADLARTAEGDVFALDRLSVNALAEHERRVLAVLALAAGALLPTDLVGAIADLANVWGVLDSLRRRGLVEQEEDRFGLPICHAEDYRALLLRYLGLAQAARELVTWLQRQAWSGREAQSAAGAALQIVGYAAERGEWPAVVRLVEAIEPVLALAGHWETWREVLERGLEAAQAVGDIAAEAHLAHQLGTLEFAVDHLDRARELWQRALRLREEIGDQAGAAVTRENLALFAPAPPAPSAPSAPSERDPRRWRWPSLRAATAAVVAGLSIAAFIIPFARSDPKRPPSTTAAAAATLGSPGRTSPGRTSPGPTSPGPTSPGPTSPGRTSPGPTSPGPTSPGPTSPGPTSPGRTSPGPIRISVSSAHSSSTDYQGSCPVTLTFAATIAADRGPVDVTYRWIASDGATSPVRTVSFPGSGAQSQAVQTTWTLGGPGFTFTGWQAIKLLTPTAAQSNHADFSITCTNPRVTVTASAIRDRYTGSCPPPSDKAPSFQAVISVSNGPVTVRYRWLTQNGGSSDPSEKTITFSGTGAQQQTVYFTETSYLPEQSLTRWIAVYILSPVSVESNHVSFTTSCVVPNPG